MRWHHAHHAAPAGGVKWLRCCVAWISHATATRLVVCPCHLSSLHAPCRWWASSSGAPPTRCGSAAASWCAAAGCGCPATMLCSVVQQAGLHAGRLPAVAAASVYGCMETGQQPSHSQLHSIAVAAPELSWATVRSAGGDDLTAGGGLVAHRVLQAVGTPAAPQHLLPAFPRTCRWSPPWASWRTTCLAAGTATTASSASMARCEK